MKNFLILIYIIVSFIGCSNHSRWYSEEYRAEHYIDHLPLLVGEDEFFLFFKIYFVEKKSLMFFFRICYVPYSLVFTINGIKGVHHYVMINNINIQSNIKSKSCDFIFDDIRFPLKLAFKELDSYYSITSYVFSEYIFHNNINLNFYDNEEIYIEIDLSIMKSDGERRNKLRIKYIPYIDKGSKWQPITV